MNTQRYLKPLVKLLFYTGVSYTCLYMYMHASLSLETPPLTETKDRANGDNVHRAVTIIPNNNISTGGRDCMLSEPICAFIKKSQKEHLWYHIMRYEYVFNEPCVSGKDGPHLLALVLSDPRDFQTRDLFRETMGSVKSHAGKDIRTVFILGLTANESVEANVTIESAKYKDIIKIAFHDSYKNYTLKTVLAFRWAVDHCSHTKFVFRSGHDVTANYREITDFTLTLPSDLVSNLFIGFRYPRGGVVSRNPNNKYFTTMEQFGFRYFPRYISGFASLFSYDVIRRVHAASLWKNLFMEDAYVSLLASENNVTLRHSWNFAPFIGQKIDGSICRMLKYLAFHRAPTVRDWEILNGNISKADACRRK